MCARFFYLDLNHSGVEVREEDCWARFLMQLLTACCVVAPEERLLVLSAVLSCF
jgi:hypothetical protein